VESRYSKLGLGLAALVVLLFASCGDPSLPGGSSVDTVVQDTAGDGESEINVGFDVAPDLEDTAGCIDEDGDGYGSGCALGFDCNDGARHIHDGAEELCDNIDNNCDGTIDEDCPCEEGSVQSCYTGAAGTLGLGRCESGWQVCTDAEWGTCESETTPGEEICDGVDNDCDGVEDEDVTNACGLCGNAPQEVCGDGLDNNCDGNIDESAAGCDCDDRTNQACYGGPPHTLGLGLCAGGTFSCDGEDWGPCINQVLPSEEVCDGEDNDCDGLVDEGLLNQCGECGEPNPREICDGIDNNCDGLVDEGLVLVCGHCSAEGLVEECGDGLDNNCDGRVDEGCACVGEDVCYPGPEEVRGIGACLEGTRECDSSGEFWGACVDYVLPKPEVCDGIDNDCDGFIDISPLGCDLCDRNIEECDRIDNDCDGFVDEHLRNACGQCLDDIVPEESCGQECCDGEDNDCDGLIDETLLNACGTCGETCYTVINEPAESDEIGEGGSLLSADDPDNPTGRGGITLATSSFIPPFIWAANHSNNTVSRFNTETNREEGRYWVGVNPSRTAVDLDGNVWIGGRNDGRLTKILWDTSSCPAGDDETISTSTFENLGPLNSAGNPMADECVVYSAVTNPGTPSIRGVAAGNDGRVWIGYTAGGIQSIDANTFELSEVYPGTEVPTFAPDGDGVQQPVLNPDGSQQMGSQGGVYGLVVDSRGYLYTSSVNRRNTLSRFDTNENKWDGLFTEFGCGSYGIAVDAQNRIWTGGYNNCQGIGMFDPAAMRFHNFVVPPSTVMSPGATSGISTVGGTGCSGHGCVTGVAVEPATGDVWASFYAAGYTGRLTVDEDNLANSQWLFIGSTRDEAGNQLSGVSNDLRGVGFDAHGFAWTLGLGSSRVWKIDPDTNQRAEDLPNGAEIGIGTHYTYSDFTGSTALSFTAPRTIWRYRFNSNYPNAQVDFVSWEAHVPEGTAAGLRIRALNVDDEAASEWSPAPDPSGDPVYHPYPTDAADDTYDLAAPGLVGVKFEIEVLLSTSDPEVLPIVHLVRLHWQRP